MTDTPAARLAIPDEAMAAIILVYDALDDIVHRPDGIPPLADRTDEGLLQIAAAAELLATAAKAAAAHALARFAELHQPGDSIARAGAGTLRIKPPPRPDAIHDIPTAITLIACQVYGDPDSPAAPDELPAAARALVARVSRLFGSAKMLLTEIDAQGLPRDEIIRQPDPDPTKAKPEYIPPKET